MDSEFRTILDSLPEKPPRSRLEPYGELIDAVSPSGTYNNLPDALDRKMFPLLAGNHGLAHAVRIAYRRSKHIHVVSATNWRASSGVVNARSGPGPPA
jgi:hypothetical protein